MSGLKASVPPFPPLSPASRSSPDREASVGLLATSSSLASRSSQNSEASFDLESYARNHDVGELVKDLQRLNQENGVQPQGSGQDHPGLHEALDSGLVSE